MGNSYFSLSQPDLPKNYVNFSFNIVQNGVFNIHLFEVLNWFMILKIYKKIRRIFFTFFLTSLVFLLIGKVAEAQSNDIVKQYLESLRQPTFDVSNDFLSYTKLVLLEGLSKKSIRDKASIMQNISNGKEKIGLIPDFGGQEKLKIAYLNYFSTMEAYFKSLPVIEIESVEHFDSDSASIYQKAHIRQLSILFTGAAGLKASFEKFCLLNRVIGSKTSGGLTLKQSEAIALISHAVKVSNAVMNTRRLNRLFFKSLREDTGSRAEITRLELVKEAANSKRNLLAIPNFSGDLSLKKTALNNVRLNGISAGKDYVRLLKFRDEEIRFKAKTLAFKEKPEKSDFDKEAYHKELKHFTDLVSSNSREQKKLDQTRMSIEKDFDDNFLRFVEGQFEL